MIAKKTAALTAAICMALTGAAGAFPAQMLTENAGITASAAEIVERGSCGDSARYVLDSAGVMTISGTGEIKTQDGFYKLNPKKIIISKGITGIGEYAFADCKELASITISDTVTNIGQYAFSGCSKLTTITIPKSVVTMETYSNFTGYWTFAGCSALTRIKVDPDNPAFSSIDGSVYNKEENELLICPPGKSGSYTAPGGVQFVGSHAFELSQLTDVVLQWGVYTIGEWAFSYCKQLTSVTLPATVNKIEEFAFIMSPNLKDIYYGGTMAQWRRVKKPSNAFDQVTIHCTDGDVDPHQGDVNNDGGFNTADVITMIAVLKGKKSMPDDSFKRYDFDGSGKYDYRDVMTAIQALKNS